MQLSQVDIFTFGLFDMLCNVPLEVAAERVESWAAIEEERIGKQIGNPHCKSEREIIKCRRRKFGENAQIRGIVCIGK
jgi:hypothetical protein